MAFADFDLDYTVGNSGALANQPNADAFLNASLASPLTTSGIYCRQFTHTTLADASNHTSELKAEIKASVSGGDFVDTPSTKALSLRVRARLDHDAGSLNTLTNAYAGINAYAPTGTDFSGGYELVLQNEGTNGVRLALRAGNLIDNADAGIRNPSINHQVTCTGVYGLDSWFHLRMDIVPNGVNQKTITAFTSVDDGATWQQVGQLVATNIDSFWRTTGRCGFISLLSATSGGAGFNNYLDDFEAFVEDV